MVSGGLLKVVEDAENDKAVLMISESSGIGKGESSALCLFLNKNADAIISDDRAFLSVLEVNGVPFLTPTVLIVAAVDSKIIGKQEGTAAIEKLNADRIIRYEDYLEAKQELEGR